MPPTRAFAKHNLRWNPFAEPPLEQRPALAVEIGQFAVLQGRALLILGEKGRGKTTHLLTLRQQFPDAPYVYLPPTGKHPPIPKAEIIFLDEAQRLPKWRRFYDWQRAKAWVVASHEDHSRELKRAGFAVQVVQLSGLSFNKLEQLVQKRLEWARRSEGALPEVPRKLLEGLLERHEDDLRAIEGELYIYFQNLESGN